MKRKEFDMQHLHLRIHHWVLWWVAIGVICGVIAMVNILTRSLTRSQDHIILLFGIIFWALGGVVSWASEAIQHGQPEDREKIRPAH
jgi:hypothetical protein